MVSGHGRRCRTRRRSAGLAGAWSAAAGGRVRMAGPRRGVQCYPHFIFVGTRRGPAVSSARVGLTSRKISGGRDAAASYHAARAKRQQKPGPGGSAREATSLEALEPLLRIFDGRLALKCIGHEASPLPFAAAAADDHWRGAPGGTKISKGRPFVGRAGQAAR